MIEQIPLQDTVNTSVVFELALAGLILLIVFGLFAGGAWFVFGGE